MVINVGRGGDQPERCIPYTVTISEHVEKQLIRIRIPTRQACKSLWMTAFIQLFWLKSLTRILREFTVMNTAESQKHVKRRYLQERLESPVHSRLKILNTHLLYWKSKIRLSQQFRIKIFIYVHTTLCSFHKLNQSSLFKHKTECNMMLRASATLTASITK